MSEIVLVGRSSSHFTRLARVFAHELGVSYEFRPVFDLMAEDAAVFAGNPALKIPVLVDDEGPLFGAENICRELARRSGRRDSVVLRGDCGARAVANAEELALHAMASEVTLIVAKASGTVAHPKVARGLEQSLARLDADLEALLTALPAGRSLSFVEAAIYCLVRHLAFRDVADVRPWASLGAFCARFDERPSARATEYRYDARP